MCPSTIAMRCIWTFQHVLLNRYPGPLCNCFLVQLPTCFAHLPPGMVGTSVAMPSPTGVCCSLQGGLANSTGGYQQLLCPQGSARDSHCQLENPFPCSFSDGALPVVCIPYCWDFCLQGFSRIFACAV